MLSPPRLSLWLDSVKVGACVVAAVAAVWLVVRLAGPAADWPSFDERINAERSAEVE